MNKKSKLQAGLTFGIGMTIYFILKDVLEKDHQTTNQIIKNIVGGLFGGAISGVLFGWLMGLFAKSTFVENGTKINMDADEKLLFKTPANHFKGIEGVGGNLYLTTKRLVFKSHKLNVQGHLLSLNLTELAKVDTYKSLGVINNGLSVTTNLGSTEKFIVEQLDEWVKWLVKINDVQQPIVSISADE